MKFTFDRDANRVQEVINLYFGGNGMEFAKAYYRALGKLHTRGKFDIIAHFDLITKNYDKANFFDITSKEYKNAVFEAIEELNGKIPFFEVNTGAISRGVRTNPYPYENLLHILKKADAKLILNADSHHKDTLDCHFQET